MPSTHLVFLLALTLFSINSFASDVNTSKTNQSPSSKSQTKEDIDLEITNNRVRTESGSKSKYSTSFGISYYGGSLKDPFSHERTDLFGGDHRPAVNAGIDFSARYRINKNSSLSLGSGLTIIQPFHATSKNVDQNSYSDKIELSSPYLTYSNFRKKGNWTLSNSLVGIITTSKRYSDLGYVGTLGSSNSFLYDFKNGINTGFYLNLNMTIFDHRGGPDNAVDLGAGLSPFLEYQINDKLNFRTVYNFALYHYKNSYSFNGSSRSHWVNGKVRQSIGLGISVNRDLYIYPNFQVSAQDFYKNTSFEDSTLGISANINFL